MIIPSFKPSLSYKELNSMLAQILEGHAAAACDEHVFEHKFAQYLGVKHAIRVPSGRWGLFYILQSLGLKEGDEVILPAFSYFAVPAAIIKIGLTPVFVDINSENLNISIQKIRESITQRTRVIIPTHLCGFACSGLDEILDIARKHEIIVIEDCAQSLGAEYKGKKLGSCGDYSYFSFGITKNFTTLKGGMIATSDDKTDKKIRERIKNIQSLSGKDLLFESLKSYIIKIATSTVLFPAVYSAIRVFNLFEIDIIERIFHEKELLLGDMPKKGQLNGIQAGLGIAQLNNIENKNDLRIVRGIELYERLKRIKGVNVPLLERNAKNIFSTCPIFVKDKKKAGRLLLRNGINTASGYMRDCSALEVFSKFSRSCPNAFRAQKDILYLPMYPELGRSMLQYIEKSIRRIADEN